MLAEKQIQLEMPADALYCWGVSAGLKDSRYRVEKVWAKVAEVEEL